MSKNVGASIVPVYMQCLLLQRLLQQLSTPTPYRVTSATLFKTIGAALIQIRIIVTKRCCSMAATVAWLVMILSKVR